MKNKSLLFSRGLILLLFIMPFAGKSQSMCGNPYNNFVPDSITAVKIADAILTPIYGTMQDERPLTATLVGDSIWVVNGTLPGPMKGGVAEIKIRKSDGKVIYVCHGK